MPKQHPKVCRKYTLAAKRLSQVGEGDTYTYTGSYNIPSAHQVASQNIQEVYTDHQKA